MNRNNENNQYNQINRITDGIIWKEMLLFFLPLLFGSFFQQLYNTADAIIVGRFVGKEALAAVGGSSTMITGLFVGFFTGLSAGATVTIAQNYGAGDRKNTHRAVHTAIAMSIAGGLLFTAVSIFVSPFIVDLMKTPADVREGTILYLRIYFCGLTANLLYNMGSGILRAVGDSKRPLYVLIACCLVNILLDIVLVVLLDMAVFGAALATVISQIISALIVLIMLARSDPDYSLSPKEIRLEWDMLERMLKIGLPAAFESVMYSISNAVIQTAVNEFDTDAVSAWAAYWKIDAAFWVILPALGVTVTTFVGQNFGAGKYKRIRKTVVTGFLISAFFTITISGTFSYFAHPILGLFTTDQNVLAIGTDMIHFLMRFYIIYIFIEIPAGALRGMGQTLIPMAITFSGACILRILWIFIIVPGNPTIHMVELSYPVSWMVTALMLIPYYFYYTRKNKIL